MPFLDMIVTKDLSFALRRDGHKSVLLARGQRRFEGNRYYNPTFPMCV